MRFMKHIRFKPKPEFMDEFLDAHKKICEEGIEAKSLSTYHTAIMGDEIVYIGVFTELEQVTDTIPEGLTWLDKHRHMLQLYSEGEGHTRAESGFIYQEN